MKTKQRFFCTLLLSVAGAFTLTGCPGSGDSVRPDEEVRVSRVGDNVCFSVPDAQDYKPANIAVNRRGARPEDRKIVFAPALTVAADKLCLPPSFYAFVDEGEFIVGFVLTSKQHLDRPRRMVSGIAISQGHVRNVPLTDMEMLRP